MVTLFKRTVTRPLTVGEMTTLNSPLSARNLMTSTIFMSRTSNVMARCILFKMSPSGSSMTMGLGACAKEDGTTATLPARHKRINNLRRNLLLLGYVIVNHDLLIAESELYA